MTNLQSISETAQYLAQVKIFADIARNPEAMEKLAKAMHRRQFKIGEKIISQGEPGKEFFVLIEGEVAVYKNTPDGDNFKVAVLSAREHSAFGEGGLMEGEVRSATILSESPSECLVLGQEEFTKFGIEFPQFALPVIKKVAQSVMLRLNQTSQDLLLLHKALMSEIRSS